MAAIITVARLGKRPSNYGGDETATRTVRNQLDRYQTAQGVINAALQDSVQPGN